MRVSRRRRRRSARRGLTQPEGPVLVAMRSVQDKLYEEQLSKWNEQLLFLSFKNAQTHGNETGIPHAWDRFEPRWGIIYEDKKWDVVRYNNIGQANDNAQNTTYLELDPVHNEEMERIMFELIEIQEEIEETNDFIPKLFASIDLTDDVLKETLGRVLYNKMRDLLPPRDYTPHNILPVMQEAAKPTKTITEWMDVTDTEFSYTKVVEEHREVIQHMHERLLLNLITN